MCSAHGDDGVVVMKGESRVLVVVKSETRLCGLKQRQGVPSTALRSAQNDRGGGELSAQRREKSGEQNDSAEGAIFDQVAQGGFRFFQWIGSSQHWLYLL